MHAHASLLFYSRPALPSEAICTASAPGSFCAAGTQLLVHRTSAAVRSLSQENAGLDPNTQLVPTAGGGWSKPEEPPPPPEAPADSASPLTAGSTWGSAQSRSAAAPWQPPADPATPAATVIPFKVRSGLDRRRLNPSEYPSLEAAGKKSALVAQLALNTAPTSALLGPPSGLVRAWHYFLHQHDANSFSFAVRPRTPAFCFANANLSAFEPTLMHLPQCVTKRRPVHPNLTHIMPLRPQDTSGRNWDDEDRVAPARPPSADW